MFEQDYIMRMINELSRVISLLVFGKSAITLYENEEEEVKIGGGVPLRDELDLLVLAGKINEAENLLFERLDFSSEKDLAITLSFYEKLNQMTDDELKSADFSREEIFEGLSECAEKFGVDEGIIESFGKAT